LIGSQRPIRGRGLIRYWRGVCDCPRCEKVLTLQADIGPRFLNQQTERIAILVVRKARLT
jgi:hypothetical protein